jgi:hypothetical protein
MKNNLEKFLFIIPFIWIIVSGCKETVPTMEECISYSDDLEKCKEAGCSVGAASMPIYVDGKCVSLKSTDCLPIQDNGNGCESVDIEFCSYTNDSTRIIFVGNSCSYNLGTEWEICTEYPEDLNCAPLAEICEQQMSETDCHGEYCMWASLILSAQFEGDVCTGWKTLPTGRCFSKGVSSTMFRTTSDGTEFLRLTQVSMPPNSSYYGEDVSWGYCENESFDPPICSACPNTYL